MQEPGFFLLRSCEDLTCQPDPDRGDFDTPRFVHVQPLCIQFSCPSVIQRGYRAELPVITFEQHSGTNQKKSFVICKKLPFQAGHHQTGMLFLDDLGSFPFIQQFDPVAEIQARFLIRRHADHSNGIILFRKPDPDAPEFSFKTYPLVALGEDSGCRDGVFEVDAFCEEGKDIALGILVYPKPLSYYDRTNPNPCDPWSMRFLEVSRWILSGGKSFVARGSFPPVPLSEPKEIRLRMNEYNRLRYTVSGHSLTLEINGETVDTVELPHYPAMGTVVTDDDESVILKIVNFSNEKEPVEITLDCDVRSGYTVGLLTGNAEDENSLDTPENVRDTLLQASGAARAFVYEAPAMSVNILTLTKEKTVRPED